ncbi:MAG: hypothetical protein JKY53_00895 [Flavobacteriales bacterium]|nr:hypothetical protein [Flavobacteriales bacterium]
MKHLLIALIALPLFCEAQSDSTAIAAEPDSIKQKIIYRVQQTDTNAITSSDAIYNRPFIGMKKTRTALGGYIEGNTNYFAEDGVSEGFSMELRRFNIFIYSSISKRIKFLSELEFEHGTEEIELETAQIDFELNTAFNFRGGIILPQIGVFNANHDSPNWELIDRPLSSTTIIPATLSEVGFGVHGKLLSGNSIISYNVYVTNGLGDGIILNEDAKTNIASGKSVEMFEEDNNGIPMLNARVGYMLRNKGEVGIAYYGGVYNSFQIEGEVVDKQRQLSIVALDFSASAGKLETRGEFVFANIDIPESLGELYGNQQLGGFIDLVYPLVTKTIFNYDKAQILVSLRAEYVDYNYGKIAALNKNIGDEIRGISIGLSFRPTPSTIFRGNYKFQKSTDFLGNPPANLGGWQFGFASYF